MKKLFKILTIVVILSIFTIRSSAKEPDEYIDDFREIIPEEMGDRLSDDVLSNVGFDALVSEIMSAFSERQGEIFSFLLMLFGCAILLFSVSMLSGELAGICEAGVGIVVSILVFVRLGGIFTEITESLREISGFFSGMLPIATAISAASGGVGTAAVQNTGMNITLWLLGGPGNAFFISIVGFGLAMSLITALGDESALGVTKGVKSFFVFLVGTVSAVLGATLSLQTVVASASDSAAIRAARYAATGFIPVVGAAVSGSLSTLVSGLTYAKSIIGAGGVAVIVTMALSPLVMLLLYRLAIVTVTSFAEFTGRGAAVRIFSAFRFSLDSMIALYTMSVLIYIIEIVIFMRGGVSL